MSGKETQQTIWPLPLPPPSDTRLNQHLNSFQDQQFQNMQYVTFREGGRWGRWACRPDCPCLCPASRRPASSLSSSEWRIPDVGQSDFILISGSGQWCLVVSPLACHTNPVYQLQIHIEHSVWWSVLERRRNLFSAGSGMEWFWSREGSVYIVPVVCSLNN